MALPDFFVAGAPKAGTTALHVALAQHPGLYLSTIKEPKFFLSDGPSPTLGGPGDTKTYREQEPCAVSPLRSTSTVATRSGASRR